MGLNNKGNLRTQADAIRNEDGEGKNTAERVGKALVDIIESVDLSLTTETNARVQKDSQLSTDIATTLSIATNASTIASQAKSEASTADAKAVNAQSTANTAKSIAESAKAVTDGKGIAGGIAPLDVNGFVPSQHLPGYVDDVVEFNTMVDDVTTQNVGSTKKSTDDGCMVVYDKTRNRFLLAVSRETIANSEEWDVVRRPALANKVASSTESESVSQAQATEEASSPNDTRNQYWSSKDGSVVLEMSLFDYYVVWADANLYGEDSATGRIPNAGKIYTCSSDNKTFRWSGAALVIIGSDLALGHTAATAFPGDEGDRLNVRMDDVEELINTKADVYDVQNLEEAVGAIRDDVAENKNNIRSLQSGVNILSTTKADASELAQVSTTATTALNSANVATQSVSAALANSTEAKNAVTALTSRVVALESESVFEELSSEAEWQELYDNGQLIPGMLYYVPES